MCSLRSQHVTGASSQKVHQRQAAICLQRGFILAGDFLQYG